MTIKKIFFFAASIINLFIIIFFLTSNSNAQDENSKYFSKDEGVLSIMYHRFEENKYPSTNIRIDVFKKHLEIIKNSKFEFYHPKDFENDFDIYSLLCEEILKNFSSSNFRIFKSFVAISLYL